MTDIGRHIRLRRFFAKSTKRGLIVPVDHGLANGPIAGIESLQQFEKWITNDAITGIVAHKGLLERLATNCNLDQLGIVLHLNGCFNEASTSDNKMLLTSIESALELGADAVSLQLSFTEENASFNLQMLGKTVDSAHRYGLPVLAMVYNKANSKTDLRHLMRATIELGVDILKVPLPQHESDMKDLLFGINGDTPIFFAGGQLCNRDKILAAARWVVTHGGSGFCMGRNIFQRDIANSILTTLGDILYDNHDNSHSLEAAPIMAPVR
ncbi:MAG: aldolase [Gammaproteobacteria bacterium]|nr:aldolase [Gammaproteobacteria bacterium]